MSSKSRASAAPSLSEDGLFQNAFEHAAIGMALVAPDGKWLRVNRSICEITGYSEEELLQRTFQDITHPDDLDLDLANVKKMLAGKIDAYQMEKRYFHKRGAIVWVLLSVSLARDDKGKPRFFISQIQDITSRKESERQLGEASAEVVKLRKGLLKICAWTKRIEIDGRWISVDEFLSDHLHLKLTHGMSVEGQRIFQKE
ncbi:MAG TPA: PAS domain S-box protein [Chthoniobacterales bacterium]|nr:PAS domain S-box protein [Chthoniobacterales bacterium]